MYVCDRWNANTEKCIFMIDGMTGTGKCTFMIDGMPGTGKCPIMLDGGVRNLEVYAYDR